MVKKEALSPRQRRALKKQDGGSGTDSDSQSSYKNLAFLCLLVFPSLFWLVVVGSDVVSNLGSVFGSHTGAFVVSGSLVVPAIGGYFYKPVRSFFKDCDACVICIASFSHLTSVPVLSSGDQKREHWNKV